MTHEIYLSALSASAVCPTFRRNVFLTVRPFDTPEGLSCGTTIGAEHRARVAGSGCDHQFDQNGRRPAG